MPLQPYWWINVMAQLRETVAPKWRRILEAAEVSLLDGVLQIRIRDADPEVMDARFTRTIQNAMLVHFEDRLQVEFVSAETEPA